MVSIKSFKSIYHEMMSPPLLIKGLTYLMPGPDIALLKILLSLRADMLYSTFFHTNKPQTLMSLVRYWQTQILFLDKNQTNVVYNPHPSIQELDLLLQKKESARSWSIKILQQIVYEIDSQGANWHIESQRNRMLFHVSKVWELANPYLSQEDITWSQKMVFYQFRGLFDHCFEVDLSVYQNWKKELEVYSLVTKGRTLASNFFIAYHLGLWGAFLKKSEPTKIDSYDQLSIFGTIHTFYYMFTGSLRI